MKKKCLFCDKTATIHLNSLFNKTKREVHLCEDCARQHHLSSDQQELNIQALLQFMIKHGAGAPVDSQLNGLACPHCGMKYAQFRVQGRLGCPEDYDIFREVLEPLLERIHRRTRHPGKVPQRRRAQRCDVQAQTLLEELKGAVREERYEEAARLRDQIRSMGIADES